MEGGNVLYQIGAAIISLERREVKVEWYWFVLDLLYKGKPC